MHRIAFHHKYSYGSSERNVSNSTPSFDVFKGFRLYLKRRNAQIRLVVEPSPQGKLGCGLSNSQPFYPRTAINSGPLVAFAKGW